MKNLRWLPVVGVMLISPAVQSTTTDDAYIAGYAAGVLKQNLNLDMPSLIVKDGVITLPIGRPTPAYPSSRLQVLVEYYNGYSPSGQFYKDKVEYVGLGAHYHF